ncbi:uncharacterized protein LOC118222137 isoform X1 [Anguilla anguilla]|uniref:uncharacterized protein LOC118222137 isoform X1 n=1 Tax=Anguilla anguilla TaxID=7936 RepID=UPI0015ADD40B|nr:uncharacterized protein LOC118222137 isoform X1 [Anguilla anguilla]
MTGPFLVYTVLLLLDSVNAAISSHGRSLGTISCVKCLDDGCLNATKVWRSQNGTDDNVWPQNGSGNSIPVCGFYSPPSETWYHVCQKNHTVFMVTNDSEASVSFTLEASGKDLKSERKTGNECPTLEPEPPTTAISCVKCLDDGCLNATKVWHSLSGKDNNVWDRNGLGNAIPVCKFYSPPSGTWFHVCKKNGTVFMVTNDTQAGVSFTLEASGKDLKSERKTGNECPTLEPEPPTTGPALECCSVGRDATPCATVPCSHAPGPPWLSPVCLTCLMIILICSSCYCGFS